MSDDNNPASSTKRREFLRGVATVSIATGFGAGVGEALAQSPATPKPTGIGAKPPTKATRDANAVYANQLAFNDTQDFQDATRGLIATLPDPGIIQVLKAAPRGIWANSHLLQAAQKTTRQIRLIPAYGEMPS